MHLQAVDHAAGAEEQHVLVGAAHEELLDEVVLAGGEARDAAAAAALLVEGVQAQALDVALIGDEDGHRLIRNQVLDVEVAGHVLDARAALVAELVAHRDQLLLDHFHQELAALEDVFQAADAGGELVALGLELGALQAGQTAKLHVEDGVGLGFGQPEAGDQGLTGLVGGLGRADDAHDLIEVLLGREQAENDVLAGLGLAQLEAGPARDDVDAVVDVLLEDVAQIHDARAVVVQRQEDHREVLLHAGVLVQVVQDHLRHGVALQLDDAAHAVAIRLVAQIGDALDLLVLD
ncbi:hypothetical protein D3C72_663170 [compost metagenome]